MRIKLTYTPLGIVSFKDIAEGAPDGRQAAFIPINGNGNLLAKIKDPRVVETEDMVGVGMREQHRVEAGHALAQGLGAEIRRGIDQYDPAIVLQEDGGAGSLIVGIGR